MRVRTLAARRTECYRSSWRPHDMCTVDDLRYIIYNAIHTDYRVCCCCCFHAMPRSPLLEQLELATIAVRRRRRRRVSQIRRHNQRNLHLGRCRAAMLTHHAHIL
jgi:hypothetical protein